jgi:hypothetical protein
MTICSRSFLSHMRIDLLHRASAGFSLVNYSPYLLTNDCFGAQIVLIGDSGVGKSCLLLRFAVRSATVPALVSRAQLDTVPAPPPCRMMPSRRAT